MVEIYSQHTLCPNHSSSPLISLAHLVTCVYITKVELKIHCDAQLTDINFQTHSGFMCPFYHGSPQLVKKKYFPS